MNQTSVSVLMPIRNEAASIRRSLGAVLAQDYPSELIEVIVVDGMSTDGTREAIAEIARQHPRIRLIDNPEGIVATGLNLAVREAKGDVVIRVDGHCEVASDYVRRCVTLLEKGSAECVGGPLETVGETYVARVIASAMSSNFGVGGSAFRVGTSEAKYVDTVAFPAYKRESLQQVGEFDEELVRNQDDEYNYRLRKLGGRILLSPDIRARYYSRTTFGNLWKQYFQYGYWKVRVMQKHPRQMQLRQFAPPLFVAALILLLFSSPFLPVSRVFLISLVFTYAILAITGSLLAALRTNWIVFPLVPIAFSIIHLAYGLGFIGGLVRFPNRWGRDQELALRDERSSQRVGIL
jgi:succinoglycan biosynthesis protein ExoA